MTHRHDDELLLAGVLAQTSGPACRRAAELLASSGVEAEAPVDALSAPDRELLDLHLERCTPCRELAGVLAALGRDLAALAEVPPDPELTDDVLAATLPVPVRWRRAWERRWERWVRRPRFAWEAALVLTAVLSVGLSAAGAPGPLVQERVVQLARTNPVDALAGPADALRNRLEPAGDQLGELVQPLGGVVQAVAAPPELREEAAARLAALRDVPAAVESGARALLRSVADRLSGATAGGDRPVDGTLPGEGASDLERGTDAPSNASETPNAPDPARRPDPRERPRP